LSSDIDAALRRLKPLKRETPFRRRPSAELPTVDLSGPMPTDLLLDTTVYIHTLQGRLPPAVGMLLAAARAWHSTVAEAELAANCGLLDPRHASTRRAIEQIRATIARMPDHRVVAPDRAVWCQAAVAAGLIARLMSYQKSERSRAFNDCLIFFTAMKHGWTVLTANLLDFDSLLQLVPEGRVLFYMERTA